MKLTEKELDLLKLIEHQSTISNDTLSKMLQISVEEIVNMKQSLQQKQIIIQYSTIIDWSKVDHNNGVTAIIDVKVAPKRGVGFDEVAQRIYRYQEVKSVYLMSGAYDLSVTVEGKTMHDVSRFVAEKLSTIESVLSTTTHFQLKKYKHDGTIFDENQTDKRMMVTP